MNLKKKITMIILFSFLILPVGQYALAVEQGTGIKNELDTTNEEAMGSLPSDSELEQQVKDKKVDIVEAGQTKEIKKKTGALWDAYKEEIKS
ncbi:hypothetical protein, partial [Staphylococcus aureus]|uniref:hypothetical protein n=1 Tax=Staphylococcus aureus TaxID=1280 RepID=UPI00190CBB8B